MKRIVLIALIAFAATAQAQIITATDLLVFAASTEKAQKDSLLKRGYTVDPTSGKELKYKAGMYGDEQVMTQPLRFFEVLTDKCSQNILTFDDGGVIFYTPDLARYQQLAKQFYALGFEEPGTPPQQTPAGEHVPMNSISVLHPSIGVTITFQTLSNICSKPVLFYVITVKGKK